MSQHDRTAQAHLTPEERREMLRAFADRMLLKITAMDDPEDMAGVERCVRVAAVIERLYSRCDRSEHHTPDPHKIEAERASHQTAAIKARVELAGILQWGDRRRRGLGAWWDAAQTAASPENQNHPENQSEDHSENLATNPPSHPIAPQSPIETPAPQDADIAAPSDGPEVEYVDYPDWILVARAELGLPELGLEDVPVTPHVASCVTQAKKPPPPI